MNRPATSKVTHRLSYQAAASVLHGLLSVLIGLNEQWKICPCLPFWLHTIRIKMNGPTVTPRSPSPSSSVVAGSSSILDRLNPAKLSRGRPQTRSDYSSVGDAALARDSSKPLQRTYRGGHQDIQRGRPPEIPHARHLS